MAEPIKSYRDLVAWQKGIELCKRIYAISATFPDAERFGLISQIRRAAVSVPSNIAEGYGRRSTGDYVRFLNIDSLVETPFRVISPPLAMASGPLFLAILGFYG